MPMDGVVGEKSSNDDDANAVFNALGNLHVFPSLDKLFHAKPHFYLRMI